MLALAALFSALGAWQLGRLSEKTAEIAQIEASAGLKPTPVPGPAAWGGLDPETLDFRPVTLSGRFLPERTVPVFTSLSEPRGEAAGPGYWIVVPFALEGGGTVFVNRGFVPQAQLEAFRLDPSTPIAPLRISGVLRAPERSGPFTPAPDVSGGIEWVRDPARLAGLAGTGLGPIAPFYVDLPAGAPGELPQGGETVMAYSNRHFEYALTWFAFAGLVPVMLVFWLRRRPVSL